MGYTHYWKSTKAVKPTKNHMELLTEIIQDHGELLQYEYDEQKEPLLNDEIIRFNGIGDDGHETLYIEFGGSIDFSFCKTARKPYDIAVQKSLLVLSTLEGFSVSSDGSFENLDEWGEALKWAENARICVDTSDKAYNQYYKEDRIQSITSKFK